MFILFLTDHLLPLIVSSSHRRSLQVLSLRPPLSLPSLSVSLPSQVLSLALPFVLIFFTGLSICVICDSCISYKNYTF
ncbi:hypothetical protein MtrunA17_Chr1g0180031 [Medicago truncatula]|uniref:Transmembrane protein n=1 Tax=Medicago truncatula TaxID=3880 RepID=A0A396JN21_MEDTR|nr:hypothetical protein MtrunA17_Chr1g0180031 [Medicago truncatula]